MKILSTRKIKARNPNTGKLEGVNFFAENATKDYLDQIDKKGKDVLGSLPDDYIEITKDVSELSEEIDNESVARNAAIAQERNRAVQRENEIEALFSMPTQEAVSKWLDEHPEATTTVQDGSLTNEKFTDDLKLHTIKDYVTPQMFGAVGDGITDDTEALQMAIDMGFELKKPVYLCGNYRITAPLRVKGISSTASRRGSVILGDGYVHIIAGASITNVIEFEPVDDDSRTYGIQIKDLIIDGNKIVTNGICSNYATSECILENITVNQCHVGVYMNGNCYLNTFRVIRGYHCTDYAILFEKGNNTSNVFEKCYSDTCANGFKVNGQYSTMISCCVDNATGIPYELHSFKGALVGCGSESPSCVSLLKTSTNANIALVGGFYYGSPNVSDYYLDIGLGCLVSIYGVTMNYGDKSLGALCKLGAGAELKIHDTDLCKGFEGENSLAGSSILFVNTGVLTKTMSVTLDENNEAELGISPYTEFILDIITTNRSGWVITQIIKDNKYFVKVMESNDYFPSISDKNFDIVINYIQKRNL